MSYDRWWSETESPKAWMSVRDADLYEALLHRLASRQPSLPLNVVEWGAGRSTLWYTRFLETLGVQYNWLTLEHDRGYFEREIGKELGLCLHSTIVRSEQLQLEAARLKLQSGGMLAVVFNSGKLLPFLAGHERDRNAALDDYVELPARLRFECDLAVIDGRKRRRCMLEAAQILRKGGYAILHDAWRRHYQCAWNAFRSGRRFGDEWWIGSLAETDFCDVLPWHAFERHEDPASDREVPLTRA